MDNNTVHVTREECVRHREAIQKQLTNGSVEFAIIKTKLNLIMAGMGAVCVALIGVLVKLAFGV